MAENKTKPTDMTVDSFLATVSEARAEEARALIMVMGQISGEPATMWGPSIIGFGSVHYRYESGHEGDMPLLGFSPRKAAITVYLMEGFEDVHADALRRLGPHKVSKSCLYITKLSKIDIDVLREMLVVSFKHWK